MRPSRLIIAIFSALFTLFLLFFLLNSRSDHATSPHHDRRFRAMFDWRAPSSLFPPSAIISLTDDNSTFFLARPANFGPSLPTFGLSGQLWVGSGFGEDDLSRGAATSAEGELGCSDVPGWSETGGRSSPGKPGEASGGHGQSTTVESSDSTSKQSIVKRRDSAEMNLGQVSKMTPSESDGTDDHLHHTLSPPLPVHALDEKVQGHADIQSLQESAEIAGKVVLLSRGGCGFLEKVKWVQRRGGTALIVGDNLRGGPLVTMYARGDTSNVTIPSLFTSHTTAHLLSSLIPSGGLLQDVNIGDVKRIGLVVGGDQKEHGRTDAGKDRHDKSTDTTVASIREDTEHWKAGGWLRSLFSGPSIESPRKANHRPPSSGNVDWMLQTDFDTLGGSDPNPAKSEKSPDKDEFVIGVHDWRDPDLVDSPNKDKMTRTQTAQSQSISATSPQGGSITPGSGEYHRRERASKYALADQPISDSTHVKGHPSATTDLNKRRPWLPRLSSYNKDLKFMAPAEGAKAANTNSVSRTKDGRIDPEKSARHDGLWVTLEPTTMSSSPFFDTLLVLVVSPLVTLTVVYALLLLRSRIRRRRWRAPKSVVDRLPVRTYQTVASSSATTSSAQVSPPGTPPAPDATTPLLHSSARPISQRPRARTAGELPVASSSYATMTPANLSLDQIQEKREAGLLEWRRRYGGKQRECVVCLEEYVDGVSRVMSLPCGHEFHAECITPWLTTRRRTCPICKGDVVRSLARSDANTTPTNTLDRHHDSYDEDDQDDLLDDVQEQAVVTRNDDPAAAEPMGMSNDFDDLERGVVPDRSR